jgi:hypothetical protein
LELALKSVKPLIIASCLLAGAYAEAGVISCGDSYRTASVSNATSCYSQNLGSTAKAGDVKAITGSSWSLVDALTSSGTDGWFTITGSGWGKSAASGTWSISDLFWDNFTSAMITMHVGGGQKNAVDNFEWLITPESSSGIFSYVKNRGKGGGLSNIKLWGMGTPVKAEPTPTNPEPAAPAPSNPAPAAPVPADPAPAAPTPVDPQPAAPTVPAEPMPAPTPLPPNPEPVVTPEPDPVPPPVFEPEIPLPPAAEPAPAPSPVSSVPEPTPWVLMLLGVLVILMLRRHPSGK